MSCWKYYLVAVLVLMAAGVLAAALWPRPLPPGGPLVVVRADAVQRKDWEKQHQTPKGLLELERTVVVGQPAEFHFTREDGRQEVLWIIVDNAVRDWSFANIIPRNRNRCAVRYRWTTDGEVHQTGQCLQLNEESDVGHTNDTWAVRARVRIGHQNRVTIHATYEWHP